MAAWEEDLAEAPRQDLAGIEDALAVTRSRFSPRWGGPRRDPVAGAERQGFAEQAPPGNVVGQQHELRRRLVVIELGDKGFEHLLDRQALVGAGKIGAVAPIVAGAEKEHLDRGLAGVLVGGEDVGVPDARGIDALMRLHVRQCRQPVAEARGALIVLLQAGIVHELVQAALHLVALAGEEAQRLVDQRRVVLSDTSPVQGALQRLIW